MMMSRDNVVEAVILLSLARIEKMSKDLRFSASGTPDSHNLLRVGDFFFLFVVILKIIDRPFSQLYSYEIYTYIHGESAEGPNS